MTRPESNVADDQGHEGATCTIWRPVPASVISLGNSAPTGKVVTLIGKAAALSRIVECIRCLEYHGLKEHAQFVVAALLNQDVFARLTQPVPGSAFERLIAERPNYVALLIAPYVDARWSCATRVDRLITQAATLRGQLGKFNFSVFEALPLLDLGELAMPGYAIVIDKPTWFCHEGLITLNLFQGKFRFFSLTFSFQRDDAGLSVIIGGIQGRKTDNILTRYRKFTKLARGMRPRDFLIEILRMIARAEDVENILGIPDRFRYHRHRYFTLNNRPDLYLDYDQVWQDRGGLLIDGMYRIPLSSNRDPELVPSKKRSMYRRRYAMLNELEDLLASRLRSAIPVPCGPVD